jgi:hypothetical protein
LFAVPWAFFPQVVHDVQEAAESLQFLLKIVHAAKIREVLDLGEKPFQKFLFESKK